MSWQPLDPTAVDDEFSASSLVPLVVLENDALLRGQHNRQAGHAYGDLDPLVVRPPTTDGPLGPISIPVLFRQMPWAGIIDARIEVSSPDGPIDAVAWLRVGDREVAGQPVTIPDTGTVSLFVRVVVPSGAGWGVALLGITADAIDEVPVTVDQVEGMATVIFEGDAAIISGTAPPLPEAVEYVLPSGRPIYIGTTDSDGNARTWPPLEPGEIEAVINEDTFGSELATVRIHGWAVTMRSPSTIADPNVADGAPLQASDLPRQRDRVFRHWQARSFWCCAGPVRDPVEFHGAVGHDVDTSAVIPSSARTSGAEAAAFVCRASGGAGAKLEFGNGESPEITLPQQISCRAMQVRAGITDWPTRDLLFREDDGAYAILSAFEGIDAASLTDVVRTASVKGSGAAAIVHVAAVSVAEVTE